MKLHTFVIDQKEDLYPNYFFATTTIMTGKIYSEGLKNGYMLQGKVYKDMIAEGNSVMKFNPKFRNILSNEVEEIRIQRPC